MHGPCSLHSCASAAQRRPGCCAKRILAGPTSTVLFAAAIRGGATLVQVREKGLESRAFAELARSCVAAAAGSGVPVLINDRVDIALASGAAPRPLPGSAPALRPF